MYEFHSTMITNEIAKLLLVCPKRGMTKCIEQSTSRNMYMVKRDFQYRIDVSAQF